MQILILYTTQTGTTKYVSEIIEKVLIGTGHSVQLHNPQHDDPAKLATLPDVILLGAPTYDDGKLYQPMIDFLTKWKGDLNSRKLGIFGLGNRTYPLFCRSADLIGEWVGKNGGQITFETLRVDGFPDDKSEIENWAQVISTQLGSRQS